MEVYDIYGLMALWYCERIYYLSRLGSNLSDAVYFSSRYAPQWEFELPGQAFGLHPFRPRALVSGVLLAPGLTRGVPIPPGLSPAEF